MHGSKSPAATPRADDVWPRPPKKSSGADALRTVTQRTGAAAALEADRTHLVGSVCVLSSDPELGRGLGKRDLGLASPRSVAPVLAIQRGAWPLSLDSELWRDWLGMLVTGGLITSRVQIAGRHSIELIGPGDILRPWPPSTGSEALSCQPCYRVAEPATLAILDRGFQRRLTPWPTITDCLMDRVLQRHRSLSLRLAFAQQPRLTDRVLLMLWHLADRWGKVTSVGVVLDLRLSQAMLAELVCAQRPSVSAALKELRKLGRVERDGGQYVLRGSPPAGC